MAADFYDLLEVSRDATADDLKRAYRRLARQLHPDTNPDPAAEERFKEITVAYEVLSDPEKRQRYDRSAPEGLGGDPFGFGAAAEASTTSSTPSSGAAAPSAAVAVAAPPGPPRGQDIEVVADLSFEEAVFGARHSVSVRTAVACETCEATGAKPGTQPITCLECAGAGQVQRVRQSFLGQMVTNSICPRCGGAGQVISDPCSTCRGEGRTVEERSYTVDIPAGVDTGLHAAPQRPRRRGPAGRRPRRPVRPRARQAPRPLHPRRRSTSTASSRSPSRRRPSALTSSSTPSTAPKTW